MDWPFSNAPEAGLPRLDDLSRIPTGLIAGDSLSFSLRLTDYPAPAYSLAFALRGVAGSQVDFTSGAGAAGAHQVTLGPGDTANWKDGRYRIQGAVVGADFRRTFFEGDFVIRPNLALTPDAADQRTHAEKVLAAIEAVMEKRATGDVLQTMIEGVQITRLTMTELLKFRDRYLREVRSERRAAKVRAGRADGRMILTRFGGTR